MMGDVIYSKCSTERKEKFQIITRIIDNNGSKVVQKCAASELAKEHIQLMQKNGCCENNYTYPKLKFVPCKKVDESILEIPFIEGESFEHRLKKHADMLAWEQLYNDIKDLKAYIFSVKNIENSVVTEEFRTVFGETNYKKEYVGAAKINIDMIPDNLILNEERVYVLDYEWIFDFVVPLHYVLFRSLFFSPTIASLPKEIRQEVYHIADINEEEISMFYKMEVNFQSYVSSLSLTEIYESIGNEAYVLDGKRPGLQYININVVGADEKNIFHEKTMERAISLRCILDKQQRVRVSFEGQINIIKLNGIRDSYGHVYKPVDTNAILNIYDDYYFDKNPWMDFEIENAGVLACSFLIMEENNSYIEQLATSLRDNNELKNATLLLEEKRSAYEAQAQEYKHVYSKKVEELENTIRMLGGEREEILAKYDSLYQELMKHVEIINELRANLSEEVEKKQSLASQIDDFREKKILAENEQLLTEENLKEAREEINRMKSTKVWRMYTKICKVIRRR